MTPLADYGFQGTERYRVVSLMGGGGVGLVYEVFDRDTQSNVALKVLQADTAETTLRFKHEFRAIQDIQHPNLITLGELGESDAGLYFTMELVDGVDFRAHLAPLAGAARLTALRDALAQLASGVAALHRANTLHRDVKPSNVLVSKSGRVVLLDFGLAVDVDMPDRVSNEVVVGTVAYMAPEQARGIDVGPPADCYAMGVMLFEVLTGRLPFDGGVLEIIMDKQSRDPPEVRSMGADVPEDLAALCMEMLSRDPAARPTALDVATRAGAERGRSSDGIPVPLVDTTTGQTVDVVFVGRSAELAALLAAADDRPRTVFIRGPSGVGKTELVRVLARRLARDELLFLSGRCYERENVPFKGIDAVIDVLVRHLRTLDEAVLGLLFNADARLLMQTFPALRRLSKLRWNDMPQPQGLPPTELRRRTFAALRGAFAALAARGSFVVIAIDDMQWADADTWAMLEFLMQPPAPPVLLVLTVCPQATGDEWNVDLARMIPGAVDILEVESLPFAEAHELATKLLESLGAPSSAVAEQLARESEGHPLFIRELARHIAVAGVRAERGTKLEDALNARIDALSGPARQLLYYVCTVGVPIAQLTIAEAAGLDFPDYLRVVGELRTSHLVRTTGSRASDKVEHYHDRIRAAALNRIDNESARELHRNLAYALEQSGAGGSDPGLLVFHLAEADMRVRAAHYAIVAAQMAVTALAYDTAATLFDTALGLTDDGSDTRGLRLELAAALVNAGRSAEAAQVYLAVADGAPVALWLDCHRRAAEQLLYCGRIAAGTELLGVVLAHIGERWPATSRRALMSLLWQRLKLRLRGHRFTPRAEMDITPRDLERVEVYKSMGSGLSLVDNIRAADYQCRHLRLALDLGEPLRIIRALSIECVFLASQASSRARHLSKRVRKMAVEASDGPSLAYSLFAIAAVEYFMDTDWDAAGRTLAEAEILLRNHLQTGGWETDTVRMFRCFCWMNSGQLDHLGNRLPAYVRAADRRGDRYSSVNLRTRLVIAHLMNDDPEGGRADVEDAIASWLPWREVFAVQHFYALHSLCEVDLYVGRPEAAIERFAEQEDALGKSMLLRIPLVAAEVMYLRGRVAVAAGDVATARRWSSKLGKCRVPLAGALAPLLAAGATAVDGDRDRAEEMLRAALPALDENNHMAHLWAARYQLALATRNDERAHTPRLWFERRGVRNVDALASMLVPGWGVRNG